MIKHKAPIPQGYEITGIDKDTGEVQYKSLLPDVLERINSDEAVLADNGHTLESFNKWCAGLDEDETATRFLKLVNRSLNGPDWFPDFDNPDQNKYEPRFYRGSSGFRYDGYVYRGSASRVSSRLCFKESRLAIHAGQTFTKWYKKVIVVKQP